MQEAETLPNRAMRAWTTHCPFCESAVVVRGSDPVRCPSCRRKVRPAGIETARMRIPDSTPLDPHDSLVGETLGRFLLLRRIGKGGMGRVYEARDTGSTTKGKRRVAIKVLNDELANDPAFVRRFRREARVLAGLSHPHVVQVLEQGEDAGRVWFAMAYVRGENLRRVIERGAVPAAEAVRIASEVASALAYAHDQGIIHRDLKPENVLLDEHGHVHLVDFGLSRLVAPEAGLASTRLTRTDVIMGTYEYMSPEQRRGDRTLDARADIFSLGVMLYEMLTGSLPLGRFALPSETNGSIPEGLDGVVNRALATNRSDRYDSAGSLQQALTSALKTAPRGGRATPPVVDRPTPAEAHRILRHVDILSALDKVAGAILLAGGLGWLSLSSLFNVGSVTPLVHIGGVVAMIGGIWLIDVGGKVGKLKKGARESQITASALMLLFPPFLTAIGIYGLVIMTSRRARLAFESGRGALEPSQVKTVVAKPVERTTVLRHPRAPSLLMRSFHFIALLWSLYAIFVSIELFTAEGAGAARTYLHGQSVRSISIVGAAIALIVLINAFMGRRERRGLGLAAIAFVFLMTASALVIAGLEEASSTEAVRRLSHSGVLESAPRLIGIHAPFSR